jgi:1-acyl-sn-glycerol-3-phosphate acyltransferase
MYRATWFVQFVTLVLEWLAFKLFLRFKIEGAENIRSLKKESLLFASNHVTHLDPLLIPVGLFGTRHFPTFMVSLSRDAYRDNWFERVFYGGTIFKYMGAYPTYRGLGNYEKSLRHQIELLEDGKSLCIFPEGVATSDEKIRPAKPGVAFLSHRTGARVVPVAIHGLEHLTWKSFLLRKHRVTLIFGKPLALYAEQLSSFEANQKLSENKRESYRRYSRQVMNHVAALKQKKEQQVRDIAHNRQGTYVQEGEPAALR